MAWSELTPTDVMREFNAAEESAYTSAGGKSADDLGQIVGTVVDEIRGAIRSGRYPLGADGTIPDSLAGTAIAMARWRFLLSLPGVHGLTTPEREDAYKRALHLLDRVADQKYAVEAPAPSESRFSGAGNSGSNRKLAMRTDPRPFDEERNEV